MKASDKPEISKKWWTSEKPDDIKGVDLEKSLTKAEKALADEEKKSDERTIDDCLKSLKDLESTVDKTIKKECDKKKHKDVISVLEKYFAMIKAENGRLSELVKKAAKGGAAEANGEKDGEAEGEDEDEKGVLKEEYRDRMIKVLRGGKEVNFCFGLNKQAPEQSKLVLCIKRKPERLQKILKQTGDFSNRLMTFGVATGDGKVLQFTLSDDAKEPSQIAKLAKAYLKSDKSLKFKKLRVVAGGETFEEDMPDSEGEDAGNAATGADAEAKAENLRKEFKQARSRWVAVRNKAEHDLEVVKDGVRDHFLHDAEQFPIAMNKMKELDDIFEHLNHDLRDALDAYVSTPLKQQDILHQKAETARQLLERYTKYVDDSPLLAAIDHKEFADVEIQRPMLSAMRDLAKTIA
jgi:hypothetical protein